MSSHKNKRQKTSKMEEIFEAYYNAHVSIQELAQRSNKSARTIYRYIGLVKKGKLDSDIPNKSRSGRPRVFDDRIFIRIQELKTEIPERSAISIQKLLQKEFESRVPSLSSIRSFLHERGLLSSTHLSNQGYIVFEREQPNDLWQIDIAGVQVYGDLNNCYLIALLDDCSRFILAAQYYPDQQVKWVVDILRQAIERHGRPNQILADNGLQFKAMMREHESTYETILNHLGIEPIYAKAHHPQTKGKLERWFGTVLQQFYPDALARIKSATSMSLAELNSLFMEWVEWYNTQKPHRSLPGNRTPIDVFINKNPRVHRPLETPVNWARYLSDISQRKVRKTNSIQYNQETFSIPPGYAGKIVDIVDFSGKLQVFYNDTFVIEHQISKTPSIEEIISTSKRIVSQSGSIKYNNQYFYLGYKLKGKTAFLKVNEEEELILVYIDNVLVKTFPLENKS